MASDSDVCYVAGKSTANLPHLPPTTYRLPPTAYPTNHHSNSRYTARERPTLTRASLAPFVTHYFKMRATRQSPQPNSYIASFQLYTFIVPTSNAETANATTLNTRRNLVSTDSKYIYKYVCAVCENDRSRRKTPSRRFHPTLNSRVGYGNLDCGVESQWRPGAARRKSNVDGCQTTAGNADPE